MNGINSNNNTLDQTFQTPTNVRFLQLIETGGYQEQVIRPYQADLRPDHVNKLMDMVDKRSKMGATKISNDLVAQVMPDAIMPTMAPIAKANIVGGWSEKRFRFSMLVETPKPNGMGYEIVYLSGYTDYYGISMNGTLDPNMKLFINNVIVIDKIYNARTQQYLSRIVGHYQVVHMSDGGYGFQNVNPYDIGGNLLEVATPDSVLGRLISKETIGSYGEEITIKSSAVIDQQGETSVKVNTSSMLPTDYLSKIITRTMDNSLATSSGFPDANGIDVLANTSSVLHSENDVSNVMFFRKLTHVNGFNPDRPYITIAELERIDPTLQNDSQNRVQVFTGGGFIREKQMPQGFDAMAPEEFFSTVSEDPSLVSEENRLASYLAEAITALMTKYALYDITVSASNISGRPDVVVGSTSTIIPDLDPILMSKHAEIEFANAIYPTVTRNNQMVVEIFANAISTGDINLTISVNGNPYIKYTFPKAADALFNPLIQNEQTMNQFTDNIGTIVNTVKDQVLY